VLDIVSCTNARASDFAAAAKVFKEAAKANPGTVPKVADGVQLYIAAASASEQEAAEAAGDWQALVNSGAQPMPPSCAQCIGLGPGLLQAGEVSSGLISAKDQCKQPQFCRAFRITRSAISLLGKS
jgi:homoaconitate hydratase